MDRRDLLKGMMAGATVLALRPSRLLAGTQDVNAQLAALERQYGGHLGVAILDTGNTRRAGYRADERFLLCSTFKMLLAAAVLMRVDRGTERLDTHLVFGKDALLEYAPVTSQHAGPPGMSIAELCNAAITLSDNTAANVLMKHLGGPHVVTDLARQLGDTLTRLDHIEPELNRPSPDGVSDTTTPNAMLANLQTLLLGHALSDTSRKQLTDWMLGTVTGKKLVRAGVPSDWRIGEKTGANGTQNNDVAILWPPQRKPLLVAAYYENAATDTTGRSAVLAAVGRIVATM
ncbi:class A beta-lactamase [Dyella nitratireducens]|uniref:Beta-lactamase n=1 Tax=Dyella nitratireducens TaxID=1849580 RepID=A0ABQ1FX52_9GAMM|nr:class A beta-lactamase [Dyella nitratireducens]GGA30433.1 beta-lactamase [Dyella nitratireducens]GLQ43007.1 beta-lactamase [Dyella nitratireducens]